MDEASSCCNFHWKLVNCPAIYFFTLLRSNAFTFALEWEVNGHWTLIQNLQYEVQAKQLSPAFREHLSAHKLPAHIARSKPENDVGAANSPTGLP